MLYLENLRVEHGIDRIFGQINLKGFMKLRRARYKSSKSILMHIRDLSELTNDLAISMDFGAKLNEGITEWLKRKTTQGNEAYDMEVNIVNQIENVVGTQNLLEVVNKRPKEMKNLLNMDKHDYTEFCNQIDYVYFLNVLKNKIVNSLMVQGEFDKLIHFNQKEGKFLNEEIESSTMDIQAQLINKTIIPYFKQANLNNSENSEKSLKAMRLIKEYCSFSNVNTDLFGKFMETNEYKDLKKVIDRNLPNDFRKRLIVDTNQREYLSGKDNNDKVIEKDERE